jgi:hypothetical protein
VAQDTCRNISASDRFTFRRTFVLRRISLHEFPCRQKLEIANTLAEFLNGFHSSSKIADRCTRKPGENDSGDPCHGGKSCICLMRLPIVFPRLTTCAKYFQSKKTGVLPGKDPCFGRHYALNYFVNSICSPSISKHPLGFSRSYFSQHISTAVVSHALPFTRLCEPASSDATIEGSINSEPCA